jgi:long-chain acyl-CoA synthetase
VAFPTFYRLLLKSQITDTSAIQQVDYFISSGSVLDQATRAGLNKDIGLTIHDYYGIAEAGPITFSNGDIKGLGNPLPHCDLLISDGKDGTEESEISVKTQSMATKYYNFPGNFESRIDERGYYTTGDFGMLDEDGNLYITGRTKDKIIIGGRNIDAHEIITVAKQHLEISDAVIYEEQAEGGENFLHMFVESKSQIERTDVVAHIRAILAPYKIPAKISVLKEFKRNGIGKIVKSNLLYS